MNKLGVFVVLLVAVMAQGCVTSAPYGGYTSQGGLLVPAMAPVDYQTVIQLRRQSQSEARDWRSYQLQRERLELQRQRQEADIRRQNLQTVTRTIESLSRTRRDNVSAGTNWFPASGPTTVRQRATVMAPTRQPGAFVQAAPKLRVRPAPTALPPALIRGR